MLQQLRDWPIKNQNIFDALKNLKLLTSPPDEPPQVLVKSWGFFVVPVSLLLVSQLMQSSGTLDTSKGMAPGIG